MKNRSLEPEEHFDRSVLLNRNIRIYLKEPRDLPLEEVCPDINEFEAFAQKFETDSAFVYKQLFAFACCKAREKLHGEKSMKADGRGAFLQEQISQFLETYPATAEARETTLKYFPNSTWPSGFESYVVTTLNAVAERSRKGKKKAHEDTAISSKEADERDTRDQIAAMKIKGEFIFTKAQLIR